MMDEGSTIDILNRNQYIDTVLSIINSESAHKNGCSFAIEGQWGVGKTFVLDTILNKLPKDKYYVFRYDCWAYDYYEEPLVALLASITDQIDVDDSCINQLVKKAKKYASVLLAENAPFIGRVVGALFAGPVGAEVVGTGINQTKKVINEVNKKEEKEIEKAHSYDVHFSLRIYLRQLQILLEKIAKEKKIVFLIDELDRCLPTYQIKVLERIHHLIDLVSLYQDEEKHGLDSYGLSKSIVVYAVNRKQLERTIQRIYGDDVKYYLKKFIDFSLVLDAGELSKDNMAKKYKKDMSLFLPFKESEMCKINWTEMVEKYLFQGLDIRTQEKLWEKRRIIHDKVFTVEDCLLPQVYLSAELMLLAMNEWRNRGKILDGVVSMSQDNLAEIMLLNYNVKGKRNIISKKNNVIKFFKELTDEARQFAKNENKVSVGQNVWVIVPPHMTDEFLLMAVWTTATNNRYIEIRFCDDKDSKTVSPTSDYSDFLNKMKNFYNVMKILVD